MIEVRDRNVYLLGAGFSASAGVPVVRDFIERSRFLFDNPNSRLEEFEKEHFREFLSFKRRMSNAREKVQIDLDDIEQLFGLVEMSQRLEGGRETTKESTLYVIAKTIELSARSKRAGEISFKVNQEIFRELGSLPPSFTRVEGYNPPVFSADTYHYFASLAGGLLDDPYARKFRNNTFITFNYDLILESALRKVGLGVEYHLPEELTVSESFEAVESSCSVLKLHGSTNWGVCGNCSEHVVVLNEKATESPNEFRNRTCEKCKKRSLQPLLIPPSWDKSEYRELMRPVWSKAIQELKQASRICVIGYSMPEADTFFKYLLALALSENNNLYKLIVVDKNPAIVNKYEALLDPLFRERRLSPYCNDLGFSGFLSSGGAISDLGRGELVWGDLRRY